MVLRSCESTLSSLLAAVLSPDSPLELLLQYLINVLDRNALALSRTLNRDVPGSSLNSMVDLSGNRYSLLVAIFFIFYSVCELYSNFMMKRFTPSKWFAGIMLAWSIVAMSQAAVTGYTGLLIARAALGIAEAGLFPGIIFLHTFFYRPEEQAFRLGLFTSVIGLSGAFSGLLATGISFLNGRGGLYGWQYLFLIEGAIGAVFAPFMWFFMPDFPDTAKFLTEEEREQVIAGLDRGAPSMHDRHFDWAEILRVIRRVDFWLFSIGLFLMTNALNAAGYFLPTLVADLGFASWRAQAMTVPPNAFGFIVVVSNALWSDYRKERVLHTLGGLALIAAGYAMLAISTDSAVRLVGVFFIACTNAAVIPFLAFRTATVSGASGTAAATGFAFAIAQLSGVSSPFLFPSQDGPYYMMGCWTIFGMLALSALIVCLLWYRLGSSAVMKPLESLEDPSWPTAWLPHRRNTQEPTESLDKDAAEPTSK